jgi:hypothetical protein
MIDLRTILLASFLAFSTALAALPFAACGKDQAAPDAGQPDSYVEPPVPLPPQLGAQLDRMGRPAIAAALVGLRDPIDTASTKQDAYNAASDPATWASAPVAAGRSIADELAANLALLDLLDKGNGAIVASPGCHNQILFNGNVTGGGAPVPASYSTLAGFLADDMLYVDTTLATCASYLSLELEAATAGASQYRHSQCGGRTPKHDAIDVSYSLLFAGLGGFTDPPGLLPRIVDEVAPHTDISESSFPYFGSPH